MFNFAKIADPDFEAFVRVYDLPPFLSLTRVCKIAGFGKTKLYELNAAGKLTIRNIEGKRGVFATEVFAYLKTAKAIGTKPAGASE